MAERIKDGDKVRLTSDVFSPDLPKGHEGVVSGAIGEGYIGYLVVEGHPFPHGAEGWPIMASEVEVLA